jgi:tRNA(fMet)-specific endonuclease VapC
MFALDTNTLIYYFKGLGHVAENMLAVAPSEIAIPAISLYELEVGLAKSSSPDRRRKQLQELLDVTEVLPFGSKEARLAGKVRAELELAGTPIGPLDLLIAAIALSHGATLVSRNTREFGRIEHLRLVDWFDAES